jgi:AhpD family alkylhydroperoxidase
MRDGRFPIHRAPLDAAIAILGKRWSSSIIDVLRHGPRRFSDVYQLIPLISHKVLIQQLRALEHDGLIVRLVVVQAPRQVSLELIHLRVSQINGCSVCVDGHWRALIKSGESMERVMTLAAWQDAPYFSDAERAALALAEAATRLSDRPDPVPDDIWDEAARHYDEAGLASLILTIAAINVWNRLNTVTRQVAGASW